MKIAFYENRESAKSPLFSRDGNIVHVLDCTDDPDGRSLAIFRDMETARKAVAALWPDAEIVE